MRRSSLTKATSIAAPRAHLLASRPAENNNRAVSPPAIMSNHHRGTIQALNLRHRRILPPAGLLLLFAASLHSAPLMVTTTADSGPGSLRQALINANLQI